MVSVWLTKEETISACSHFARAGAGRSHFLRQDRWDESGQDLFPNVSRAGQRGVGTLLPSHWTLSQSRSPLCPAVRRFSCRRRCRPLGPGPAAHLSGPGSAGSRALLTATFHFLASQLVAISFWSETRLQIQPRARVCFTPERLGDARPAPQPRPRGPAEPFVPAPLGWTPSRSRGRRDPAAPRRQTALGSAPPGASCWRRGRAARGRAGAGPGAAARPPASRAERSGAQGPRGSGRPAAAAADGEERRRRPAAAACPVEAPEKELRMRLPWKAKMVTGSSRGVRGRLCVAASVCAAGRSPAGSVRGCGGSLCGSSPRSSRHVSG